MLLINLKSLSINNYLTALFTIVIFALSFETRAQKTERITSDFGKIVTIHSNILNEDRQIYIYSPQDSLHKAYPVIYVLDAENHFNMVVEYSKSLSRADVNGAPPHIVVGIKNTDRNRDLTPTHSNIDYLGKLDTAANSWLKNTGGNDHFFQFIKNELKPYVSSHYKTQPYSIFAGHSFGGITTINCMFQYPDMFDAYIAVSPSFWWDQKYLLKLAYKKLESANTSSKSLFFTDGDEGIADVSDFHLNMLEFDSLLRTRKVNALNFKYAHYPEESHGTVPIKSYYDGLRFIYKGWHLPRLSDEEVNREIVMKHYNSLSERFGYKILPDEAYFDGWGQWLIKNPKTLDRGISLLQMNADNYSSSEKAIAALAAAYAIKGEKKKAIDLYKKASKLNPHSNEIELQLQKLQK